MSLYIGQIVRHVEFGNVAVIEVINSPVGDFQVITVRLEDGREFESAEWELSEKE